MNFHNISKDDSNNGDGLRVVLWVSGCSHNCVGCHNPLTHDSSKGSLFTRETEKELFDELNKEHIAGITFSGGDPLHKDNVFVIISLIKKIRYFFPSKTIWLYSGYTLEEVLKAKEDSLTKESAENTCRKEILSLVDVLIDGRYENEKRNTSLQWRGSSNQKIYFLKENFAIISASLNYQALSACCNYLIETSYPFLYVLIEQAINKVPAIWIVSKMGSYMEKEVFLGTLQSFHSTIGTSIQNSEVYKKDYSHVSIL